MSAGIGRLGLGFREAAAVYVRAAYLSALFAIATHKHYDA